MKRNKLLAIVILFAVVVCCTSLFFACNTGTQDSEESLRIFYDWADGSAPIEKVIKAKDVASVTSALTPPTRDGYAFIGWSLTKDGDRIVFDQDTVIADGATLYALWQYTRITLYYDLQDGSEAAEKLIEKADIKSTSQSMVTTKEGYDFAGWALAKDGDILDMDNLPAIQDGSTLYAQWKVKEYNVIFSIDEFTVVERQNVEHGKTATLPSKETMAEYVANGKSFVGWVYPDGSAFDESKPITQRTVVYAVFDDVNYTVKFQNGDDIIKEVTGGVGTQIVAPLATEQPSKSGYTFSHWATKDGKKFEEGAVYRQDETYYATYTLNAPSKPSLSGNNTITYGESQTISAQINDSVAGITYSFVWSMNGTTLGEEGSITLEKLSAGKYTVLCEAIASDGTLTSATNSAQTFEFNVEKATLTATIDNINLTYGDKLPEFVPTYTGFKYDDDSSVVKGSMAPTTTYSESSNVGTTYYAALNGLYADNYDIVGTFGESKTITASITVAQKAISSKESVLLASKTYDGSVFSKQYSNDDFNGVLSGHTLTLEIATKSQNTGVYTHDTLQKSLTIVDGDGVDVSANYSATYSAQLTITNADIDYTAPTALNLTYNGTLQSSLTSELKDESGVTYSREKDGAYATKEPSFKNAGEYTVYYKIERENHNTVEGSYSVNVAKANITISPKAQPSTSYGKESFALAQGSDYYEISGDIYDVLDITLSTNYTVGMSVGRYDVSATLGEDENGNHNNYNATCNTTREALEVVKATLTLTLENVSVVYHNNIGDLFAVDESGNYKHFTISGLYKDDNVKDVILFTISNDTDTLWNSDQTYDASLFTAGEYELSLMGTTNDNYFVAPQHSTYTVAKRSVTLSVEDKQITYGDNAPVYTFTSADEYALALELNYSCSFAGAGKYDITATLKESDYASNFDVTSIAKGTLTVQKRAITLKANDKSIVYGDYLKLADCTYDVTQGSIVDGDTITASFASAYSQMATQWSFDIEITGVDETSAQNYDVTLGKGTLTVQKRTLYVKYTNLNVAYNDGNPHVFEPAIENLWMDDHIDMSERMSIKTTSGDLGNYYCEGNSLNGRFEIVKSPIIHKDDANETDVTEFYDFEYDLQVTIREIEIEHTITGTTYKYDGTRHNATMQLEEGASVTYTYNADTFAEMPSFINAGEYTVHYTLTKEGSTSYNGEFTLTISKRQTIINVADATRQYGDSNTIADFEPYTISGDSILEADKDALNIQHSFTADEGSSVGEYPFNLTYTENDNYSITVNNGKLTIEPKQVALHPTVDHYYTVTYGTEPKAYTHVMVHDYNSFNVLSGAEAYFKVLPKTIPDGYKYIQGNNETVVEVLSDSNGKVNYTVKDNHIRVNFLALDVTIKVDDLTITYGQCPAYSYTLLEGTILDGDVLRLNYTPEVGSVPNSGSQSISAVPRNDYPYSITVQSCGTLTVNKATLTATLSGASTITYGDGLPTYTVSKYDGFKFATENDSLVKGTLNVTSDYLTQQKVGEFAITASGLSADNYNIVFKPFTVTVEKAPLTITANPHGAITYGDDLPTDFTYTATGFKFSDTDAILQGKVSFTSNYTKGADTGSSYTFNVANNITLDNYTVSIGNAQSLVVNKANYTEKEVNKALANVNLSGTYSPTQTLANFSLAGKGFAWVNSTQTPTCDNTLGYSATYCGDPLNYNTYSGVRIKISLAKAQPNLHMDGSNFGTDWTGSAIAYTNVISVKDDNADTERASMSYTTSVISPTGVANIVDGGVYTILYSLAETTNYESGTLRVPFKVYSVDYNGTHYTVEDALQNIASGTLTLFGNAFVSSNVSVPKNVTLILPITHSYTATAGKVDDSVDYNTSAVGYHAYTRLTALHTLTIPQNITMTLNGGNVIVVGVLGNAGRGLSGQTSGEYSQIINNGNIVVNSGILDVRGYIMGTGKATFNGGTVYSPFVVRDFKGGTYTVYKAWLGVNIFGAINKIAPFSEYEMINIQCASIYNSGTKLQGYADLYASSKHNITTADMISSTGVIRLSSGASLTQMFDKATGKSTLTFKGNITIGSLSLDVAGTTVKMSDTYSPLPWTYNINIGDGAVATTVKISNHYKVLPGCTITIKTNATVNASDGNLIIYSDWTDDNSIQKYPTAYGTAGKLILDGGTINAYELGGIIYATSNGGTIKASNAVSVTAKEHNNSKSYEVTEKARFEDGTALSKNKTYTYNGSSWVQA